MNEKIISLVKEIQSVNALEDLIKFINTTKKVYSCNAYKNGKELCLLESDINMQSGMSIDTIEIKLKETYHVENVNGITVHYKGAGEHSNETVYKDFIKFKIDVNQHYPYKKINEPEIWEMDEKGNWDKFIKEVSDQVDIQIYNIEIFE